MKLLWVRTIVHCPVCTLFVDLTPQWSWTVGDVAWSVVFFFCSWEDCIGWLCFRCRCMLVALARLVATEQMRHTSSHSLSGSPRSFSLNPSAPTRQLSRSALKPIPSLFFIPPNLAFSLACYSSWDSHAAAENVYEDTHIDRLWLCVTPGLRLRALPTQRPCSWQVTDTTQGLTPH